MHVCYFLLSPFSSFLHFSFVAEAQNWNSPFHIFLLVLFYSNCFSLCVVAVRLVFCFIPHLSSLHYIMCHCFRTGDGKWVLMLIFEGLFFGQEILTALTRLNNPFILLQSSYCHFHSIWRADNCQNRYQAMTDLLSKRRIKLKTQKWEQSTIHPNQTTRKRKRCWNILSTHKTSKRILFVNDSEVECALDVFLDVPGVNIVLIQRKFQKFHFTLPSLYIRYVYTDQ